MIERMVGAAFPQRRVVAAMPFPDGFRNTNVRIELDGPPSPLVLRIYRHDPALCQKELDLLRRLTGRVPVPKIVHAEPAGIDGLPPFTLHHYIEGITLGELKRTGDRRAVAEAAYSAGETLAAIGRVPFEYDGPSISIPQFVDECLASPALQQRLNAEMRDHASTLAWSAASEFAVMDQEKSLVHCDYGKRNLLVRSCAGRWQIAAVLDWEFAISASPLIDLGHMLRYECATRPLLEPHFSKGFTDAGGVLREDWRRLSKIFDLSALCELLTRESLPADAVAETVEVIELSLFKT